MRVLVACEFSGIVREAFWARGINAVSVDLLPTEKPGSHFQADILDFIRVTPYAFDPLVCWDMMIAFPPCTHLAVCGSRWFKNKQKEQAEAIAFVEAIWKSRIPRIAIENPVGVLSTKSILGKPTQIIHPWQFGHAETKTTCLWLKGLPLLKPTRIIQPPHPKFWTPELRAKWNKVHREPPGPDRWRHRSRTYKGVASAMAEQWGMEIKSEVK